MKHLLLSFLFFTLFSTTVFGQRYTHEYPQTKASHHTHHQNCGHQVQYVYPYTWVYVPVLVPTYPHRPHQTIFEAEAVTSMQSQNFKCNKREIRATKKSAEQLAMQNCYNYGYRNCYVRDSYILATGYLEEHSHKWGMPLGYGCIARAMVRGQ